MILQQRINASPEEMAAWVWMGPKDGGLAAYLNANNLDPPPRFFYDLGDGQTSDYLSPLMACWFLKIDIVHFQPADRFITGKTLIERWSEHPGIQPVPFIRAKIREDRLFDYHPIFGGTRGSFSGEPDYDFFPSIETGLFPMSLIKAIEDIDFGRGVTRTSDRNAELQTAANDIANQWNEEKRRGITKRDIAEELAKSDGFKNMTASRIERIIRVEW